MNKINGHDLRRKVRCPYCEADGYLLEGPLAEARYEGWTRYSCPNGHRFAVPTYQVMLREQRKGV